MTGPERPRPVPGPPRRPVPPGVLSTPATGAGPAVPAATTTTATTTAATTTAATTTTATTTTATTTAAVTTASVTAGAVATSGLTTGAGAGQDGAGSEGEGETGQEALAGLGDRPVSEHVAVFEAEHDRLQRRLATIDQL